MVQVALLTWYVVNHFEIYRPTSDTRLTTPLFRWDAVVALVNRTPCVFPYEYFESVLVSADGRFWTFFGLCGCPQSLAVPLVQLAHLASEKQKSASMGSIVFDDNLVSEIEEMLESWHHTSAESQNDEESVHQDVDRMHCSEAWRNGLLLYIYRVFRWKPTAKRPTEVLTRARAVLDHACSCRDDYFLARQALLPLFFAGCEMTDPFSRTKIKMLCSLWNERTRYHMFSAMIPLLEEVWAAQDFSDSDYVWWGQVIDRNVSARSQDSLQVSVCFG